MSSTKLTRPIRLFFLTSPRTITTIEESQAIYSFFNSKGELREFKLQRVLSRFFFFFFLSIMLVKENNNNNYSSIQIKK